MISPSPTDANTGLYLYLFQRNRVTYSEKIAVEDRREDSLLNSNFGRDREYLGGVVEMVSEEEKPAGY